MEKATSNKLDALVALYDMQTTFFNNALEGISDEDAHNRLQTKANHIAWLTGSLVQQRFELLALVGENKPQQQAHELFENNKGIQDGVTYPSLSSFKEDWKTISPSLREALLRVTDEKLDSIIEMGPDMKMSVWEMLTFIIYREANCIGQIALWRRLLGYDAMKYM